MPKKTSAIDMQENISLQPYTTLRAPVRARWFVALDDASELPDLLEHAPGSQPPLVLGEGSNCLFTRDYDGLVIRVTLEGIKRHDLDDGATRLVVAAGENWHRFVRWTLDQGLAGIENLALIPGTVGAAPIQNIGAYGVEVESCIASVTAYDRNVREFVELAREDCGFAYRDSIFKQEPHRYVVTAVSFDLRKEFTPHLDYAGLRERLATRGITDPGPVDVADAVESLRREKLPDPALLGNAGSFFKNPVVAGETAAKLRERHPDMPAFDTPAGTKLSAGWLIEQAGMKGYRDGDAGISDRHALVLVNHGNATGEQLWAVAAKVREAVRESFGIELEPEPRVY
ncbi:MAG: UDP-N-acetylmuramate dehydrogenase [Gammaproteobacteria bacterium]|nr:UDP-N-acetylmuramate dehydrogenase [Gammaproteobacteria bacterium]